MEETWVVTDRELLERLLAAQGAFRNDLRALLAAVSRVEWIVSRKAPGAPSMCDCHAKDWEAPGA